jgi:phage terminase large subunit
MELHPAQKKIAIDNHRFRVVVCGRRFGKSTLAVEEMRVFAYAKPGSQVVYVAPTIKQARDIAWRMLKDSTRTMLAQAANETRLELTVRTKDPNKTSEIWLRGTENVESLRGQGIDFLIVDEVASMRGWDETWHEVLRPTLTDSRGQALFIGTPRGYDHFYNLYLLESVDSDYKSFHYSSYDNPCIPADEIDKAKEELDEDTFAQEYLAEFKKFTGLVYKDFSRDVHVISLVELMPNWNYYRSIDFGFVHPTAVGFYCVNDKGVVYKYDEIYQAGLQTPDLAELIKQKSVGRNFVNTIADSAQASDIDELRKYGIGISGVSKTSGSNEDWTVYKIRKVTEKLRNGAFFVFSNCVNTIREFENYHYHEINKDGVVKEVPMKIDDHAMDEIAYFVVSLPERMEPQVYDVNQSVPYQWEEKQWRIGK